MRAWYTAKGSFKERIEAAQMNMAEAEQGFIKDVHDLTKMELVANKKEELIKLFRTKESL